MLGHACPARACQSQRTPHLPSLLRYPRGPELHLDMPWCAWPALSPNCRGRGAVDGPVQTGDPELHVCRAQPPSPPAFKPSSERKSACSSSSGEPCPDSSLILKPIVHPPASTAPPCWIEIGRVFQLHQPAHIAVRAGGSSMRFVFPGLGAGAFAR